MAFYRDRADAAEDLIRHLPDEVDRTWVVLALPRGGVPIAAAIAAHLGARLGLLIVRKVGVPGNPELALAAVTGAGPDEIVVNDALRRALGLSDAEVLELARPEVEEIARRRRLWLADEVPLASRPVLIVDDGVATGATLRAAVEAARRRGAARIGVALPVALGTSLLGLSHVSPVVCPHPAAGLSAVGAAYSDFPQVSDSEVTMYLSQIATDARPGCGPKADEQ